ncbi:MULTISPECIES: Rieske 2Fe-2S domain-containing protein [Paraburkholderia]|uniref:Rieske 2Fe-2S domain-containing protein n=1 Tax=Paraburkholderia TaxID=1822464 RepID=UPI00036B515C|nr:MULTISPECIES: Rieske 2Fe-2S domain-containing protein [Paraburkholderia]MDH6148660.1 nitrite reductase/ring-hydroxylating ferredoxin subunit [Paraburkholderia sp. WSM4179]
MSDPTIIRRRTVSGGNGGTSSQYQPYRDAAWGFVNHWYPALFSRELVEDQVEGVQICGIPIVLRRANGKVHALKDQCLHRGVRLSEKPMCFNKKTISCWYHGFTFDLETGNLATIIANPEDRLIGTVGITSYPVHEVAGMIFVFVRDDDFPLADVPPLEQDLPVRFPTHSDRYPHPLWPAVPSLLDENAVAMGIHRIGFTNWRIACENGIDNAHLLLHKDNSIIHAMEWVLPLGLLPNGEDCVEVLEDPDGPKGMLQWLGTDKWQPVLENKELGLKVAGLVGRPYRTSIVLPGLVAVENWPGEHMTQLEWFVPITDDTHEYWEVIVRICNTPEELEAHKYRYERVYEPLALHGFNDCDIYARESMEDFYGDGTGWENEKMVATDISAVTWRKVASRWNRGIAKPGRGVPGARKDSSLRFKRAADGKRMTYKTEQIED